MGKNKKTFSETRISSKSMLNKKLSGSHQLEDQFYFHTYKSISEATIKTNKELNNVWHFFMAAIAVLPKASK